MTQAKPPTVAALLTEYNCLVGVDETKHIKEWKGRRAELEVKLQEARELAKRRSCRTIKDLSIELLLTVDYNDAATGRPVGLPYDEILRRVHAAFPDCETTVECLRWYAVRLNNHIENPGVRMPFRPRKRPAKKAKKETENEVRQAA